MTFFCDDCGERLGPGAISGCGVYVHLNASLWSDSAVPAIGGKAIHHDTSNGHRRLRVV